MTKWLGRKEIKTDFFLTLLMAKQLGQIHTVNYTLGSTGSVGLAPAQDYLIDLPGQLTQQLQRMVRMNQYFKVVGIDMAARPIPGASTLEPLAFAGVIEYYAPNIGRCNAIKQAYRAIRKGMDLMGINLHGNRHYDCRIPITDPATCVNGAAFLNQATIDGTNVLTLDESAASATDNVFTVYNSNIQPADSLPSVNFSEGYGLPGTTAIATDFVLNEGELYKGSLVHHAANVKESIPFQLSFGQDTTSNTSTVVELEWRPDPAFYLAVLSGQLIVKLVDSETLADYRIDLAVHVSGWKSILGDHKRKRRSKKGKSHGRKRHSKK